MIRGGRDGDSEPSAGGPDSIIRKFNGGLDSNALLTADRIFQSNRPPDTKDVDDEEDGGDE